MATIMSWTTSDGTQRCDAKCHNAHEPECVCCCGGRYHGCARRAGREPTDIIDAEMAIMGIDPDKVPHEVKVEVGQRLLSEFAPKVREGLKLTMRNGQMNEQLSLFGE